MFIFIYTYDVDIVSVSFFVSLPNHANSIPTWNVSRLRSNILLDDTTRNNFGNIPLASFFLYTNFSIHLFFSFGIHLYKLYRRDTGWDVRK